MTQHKTSFTPGPWHFSEIWRPPIGKHNPGSNADGNVFWGYSISGSNEHGGSLLPTLATVHNFPNQIKANAHLIAAAPDLWLNAMIEDAMDRYGPGDNALDYLRGCGIDIPPIKDMEEWSLEVRKTALKKARGES